jgi:pimeloyl-ACP methyl ester carboxylesterase
MRTTSQNVPVSDIDVACTVVGEGTPLVVLHGAIGLGSTYMRALDAWGEDLQLIHYDQRGSGNTPLGDAQRVSFAGGVEDLEALRHYLGLPRIQVLGHSAGAYLAAMYAAEHPANDSERGAAQPWATAGVGTDGALREDNVEPPHPGRRRRTHSDRGVRGVPDRATTSPGAPPAQHLHPVLQGPGNRRAGQPWVH